MSNSTISFKEKIRYNSKDIFKKVQHRLKALYYYYTDEYIDLYKKHFSDEYKEISTVFPEIDFTYEGRLKNENSLAEKIHRKLSEGYAGQIYDIFAKKIIIYSVNGKTDEASLIKGAYQIAQYLKEKNNEVIELHKLKDYILSPKPNGYKALHLLRTHILEKNKNNFNSELQIRTFRMEEQQMFGTSAHFYNYKPRKSITPDISPIFFEIGKNGKAYQLPPEKSLTKYKWFYESLIKYFEGQKQEAKKGIHK